MSVARSTGLDRHGTDLIKWMLDMHVRWGDSNTLITASEWQKLTKNLSSNQDFFPFFYLPEPRGVLERRILGYHVFRLLGRHSLSAFTGSKGSFWGGGGGEEGKDALDKIRRFQGYT